MSEIQFDGHLGVWSCLCWDLPLFMRFGPKCSFGVLVAWQEIITLKCALRVVSKSSRASAEPIGTIGEVRRCFEFYRHPHCTLRVCENINKQSEIEWTERFGDVWTSAELPYNIAHLWRKSEHSICVVVDFNNTKALLDYGFYVRAQMHPRLQQPKSLLALRWSRIIISINK